MKPRWLERWVLTCILGASSLPGCADSGRYHQATLPPTYPVSAASSQTDYPASYPATPYHTMSRTGLGFDPATTWTVARAPVQQAPMPAVTQEVPAGTEQEEVIPVRDDTPATVVETNVAEGPQVVPITDTGVPITDTVQPQESAVVGPPQTTTLPGPAQAEPEVRSVFPRAEPTPARKSFVDISAAPCFGHAQDYSWITGQVEHSLIAKEWRLRYASVDEPDRFGGRVILIENQHVNYLTDGAYVHVQGHVLTTDGDGGPAYYRIESFENVQDPNGPASHSAK
jgi:hypothetical protein